jgi:hypothetical protein
VGREAFTGFLQTSEEVLRLYREVYFDLNMRHFHEKLGKQHGIGLSYAWVQSVAGSRIGGEAAPAGVAPAEGPCRGCCCTLMAASING